MNIRSRAIKAFSPVVKKSILKANKYGNKKVKIDGYTFDSKLEAKRYTQLKMLLRAGKIQSLSLQPKFILQEGFSIDGKKYQAITYIADFKYLTVDDEVKIVIEDVKGKITTEYALKKKMFLKRYGDEVIFRELYQSDI